MSLNFIDLFSGIGGFHQALKKYDKKSKCVLACDIDKNCQEVYFDNYNINLQSKNFFKQISYVPQSIFLFDDSIKNNIIFNDIENFDEKKFQLSIKISKLDNLLNRLPSRENTNIGEIGKKISGGEKQRIGIARAVYKNPDILILDEATNALDSETEKQIFSELQKFVNKKKILIFVSHKEKLLKYSNKTIKL